MQHPHSCTGVPLPPITFSFFITSFNGKGSGGGVKRGPEFRQRGTELCKDTTTKSYKLVMSD